MKSMGTAKISLYINVPSASKTKPTSYQGRKSSQPRASETAQMVMVLAVSMVDLWAPDANLVTATPVASNNITESIMANELSKSGVDAPISRNAALVSSRYPYGQNLASSQSENCYKMGKIMAKARLPHMPSSPTT